MHILEEKLWRHFHVESDGSLHLVLSDIDTKTIWNKSWGERHLMTGKIITIKGNIKQVPNELVMIKYSTFL